MADTNEAIDDIIAEKRALADGLEHEMAKQKECKALMIAHRTAQAIIDSSRQEADRLEAALQRECGETAKLRDALTKVKEWMEHRIAICGFEPSATFPTMLEDVVLPALSVPPRNCNRFETEDTIQYGDIFIEVRQRVAAFQYWKEFTNQTGLYGITEGDYLDEAYRFLYSTARKKFIEFCAAKDGKPFEEYCKALDIDVSALL